LAVGLMTGLEAAFARAFAATLALVVALAVVREEAFMVVVFAAFAAFLGCVGDLLGEFGFVAAFTAVGVPISL
jgi:hypothetical protein